MRSGVSYNFENDVQAESNLSSLLGIRFKFRRVLRVLSFSMVLIQVTAALACLLVKEPVLPRSPLLQKIVTVAS